jgi:cytochrome P450
MWMLFCLAKHPNHQETIYDEITAFIREIHFLLSQYFSKIATPDECLSDSKLNELSFLDRFMKESQRLYPSVPGLARYLDEAIVLGMDGK